MVTLPPELLDAPELALYEEQIRARLEQEQLERQKFRDELSPDIKAEFINGKVFVHSPATHKHNVIRMNLATLLATFVRARHLGEVLDEQAMIGLTRNDYEPDVIFFNPEKAKQLKLDQLIFPAPDFVVEILSPSTERNDRGVKYRDYAAHAVKEYWIIDPVTEVVEQYENLGSSFQLNGKVKSGEIESRTITEFKIPVRAIFDPKENLAALRQILAANP